MQNLNEMKTDLTIFWSKFGGKKNTGFGYSKQQKLQWLIEYAKKKYFFIKRQSLEQRRESFNAVKFKRHSLKSHPICFVCQGKAELRHHILTLAGGAHNSKRNIVSLCEPCHKKIHPWL